MPGNIEIVRRAFAAFETRDAEALVETIARYGVDMIDTTPSMFAQLHAVGLLTTVPLRVLALGGEAVGSPAWNMIR